MASMKELFQSADWKKEKHVPVIEAGSTVKKGEVASITVSVGKEIAHPNTVEHHIRYIEVYFLAEGEKFPLQLARAEFSAHGESAQGANAGCAYTHPQVSITLKLEKSGTLVASAYCNIHGLWESSQALTAA